MKYYQLLIAITIGFVAGYLTSDLNVPIEPQGTESQKYEVKIIDSKNSNLVKYSESKSLNDKVDLLEYKPEDSITGYFSSEPESSILEVPESVITPEDASVLPYPYSEFVSEQTGYFADSFNQLQTEEVNLDWASELEQKVWDYFSSHELATSVNLSSVKCASSVCEFMGTDTSSKAWVTIYHDMEDEDWYIFNESVFTTKTESNDKIEYFYVLSAEPS